MRTLASGILFLAAGAASAGEPVKQATFTKKTQPVAAAAAQGGCAECAESAKPGFASKLFRKLGWGDTGVDQPVGCDNLYTDCKFIFGGCRSFYGTGTAAAGHGKKTVVPQ